MNAMNPLFNPDGAAVEGVYHRVRLVPVLWEKRHISEICDDAYWGEYNDFEWHALALNPPKIIGTSETEEEGGEIWFTFRTVEPMNAIRFVSRIAGRFPTLNIVHDYEQAEHELFGRLWYRNGVIYKQAHLTPLEPLQPFLRSV